MRAASGAGGAPPPSPGIREVSSCSAAGGRRPPTAACFPSALKGQAARAHCPPLRLSLVPPIGGGLPGVLGFSLPYVIFGCHIR